MRILIVEDAPTQQLLLTEMVRAVFNGDAQEIVCAGTLKESQEIVAGRRMSLAIVDLQLADADPHKTIAEFPFGEIPTIVLTAMTDPRFGFWALNKGAMYYFRKPIQKEDWNDFGATAANAVRNHALQVSHTRLCKAVEKINALDNDLKKVVEVIKTEGVSGCQGAKPTS